MRHPNDQTLTCDSARLPLCFFHGTAEADHTHHPTQARPTPCIGGTLRRAACLSVRRLLDRKRFGRMNERRFPRIASYHSGPYRIAAILSDPGRPDAGRGAVTTNEIGVLNYRAKPSDQTARMCHAAVEHAGLQLSDYLPMNAVPWYDGTQTLNDVREGAMMNAQSIRDHGIDRVLLLGATAQRSRTFLESQLPDNIRFALLAHPGTRGIGAWARSLGISHRDAKAPFLEEFSQFVNNVSP
jgi:hypothetical protein